MIQILLTVLFIGTYADAQTIERKCPRLENAMPTCVADSSGGCPYVDTFYCDNESTSKEGKLSFREYCPGTVNEAGRCDVPEKTVTYCSDPPKPCCEGTPVFVQPLPPDPDDPNRCYQAPPCPAGKQCSRVPPSQCRANPCSEICAGKDPSECVQCGNYDCNPGR